MSTIAGITGKSREEITDYRIAQGIIPTYKMVDTCAAEFAASTPYYYSSYDTECELSPHKEQEGSDPGVRAYKNRPGD